MEHHPSFIEILTANYVSLKPKPTSLHSKAYGYPGINIDFLFIYVHLHICMQKYLDEWAPAKISMQLSFHVTFCVVVVGLLQTSCQSTLLPVFGGFVMLHLAGSLCDVW